MEIRSLDRYGDVLNQLWRLTCEKAWPDSTEGIIDVVDYKCELLRSILCLYGNFFSSSMHISLKVGTEKAIRSFCIIRFSYISNERKRRGPVEPQNQTRWSRRAVWRSGTWGEWRCQPDVDLIPEENEEAIMLKGKNRLSRSCRMSQTPRERNLAQNWRVLNSDFRGWAGLGGSNED